MRIWSVLHQEGMRDDKVAERPEPLTAHALPIQEAR
jgi:hypothetical protein